MTGRGEVGLVPLGGSGWALWEECELRSAGFPVAMADLLGDAELAACDPASAEFAAVFEGAAARLTARLREVAGQPRFREAVGWQNPGMLERCVDKVGTGSPAKGSVRRRRELKVASYLQRYTLKNDTIGFFGPVGWAGWSAAQRDALRVRPGAGLLRQRRVYVEHWAVEAVAAALCRNIPLWPWVRPRRVDANLVTAGVARRPRGKPVPLTAEEARVLAWCDGHRTAAEIAGCADLAGRADGVAVPGAGTGNGSAGCSGGDLDILRRLHAAELVVFELDLPVVNDPELRLRAELLAVPDTAARTRALAALDELVGGRDEVAAAAGDPDKLVTALERLDGTFERITGQPASRRGGQAYAGRRLVYEDTVRDMTVGLGGPLLGALAAPLGLLLDSARWFVGQVAAGYRQRFLELFEACRARTGSQTVPFPALLAAATPDLAFSFRELPGPVAARVPELQRRWSAILRTPPGARRHAVRASEIGAQVAALFPAAAPPWSSAVHYCPDILIAAPDVAAVNRGDFLLVLGELHLARNTLDCRVIGQQHPAPERLLAADARDRGGRRVVPVPARASGEVNSRTYPPVLLRPDYLYWTVHTPHTGAPGPVLPGAGMVVRRVGDDLLVSLPNGGPVLDLMEVLGEYLSAAVMNGFKPVPAAGHRPRVSIDRMVICRESWSFPATEIRWPFRTEHADRFRAAQQWRREQGLPDRAFCRLAAEDKPVYVDFASIALVDLLAAGIRSSVEEDGSAPVAFTELLPGRGQHWLRDADGAAYTCELRLVAVDPARSIQQR